MNEKERVSVCVVTYNSSRTVTETLDSILNQTYLAKNIELIISDDASKDDTKSVVNNWLSRNKGSFFSVNFIVHEQNIGVTRNINSSWKVSSTQWIKTIAGDDILLPNCIDSFVEYKNKNLNCKICFSDYLNFYDSGETFKSEIRKDFFELPQSEQLRHLAVRNYLPAISSFISREVLDKVGFANERYRTFEDYPLWVKISEQGYEFFLLDEKTVLYRKSESITYSNESLINIKYKSELLRFYVDELKFKDKNEEWGFRDEVSKIKIELLVSQIFNNRRSAASSFFMKFMFLIFRPYNTKKRIVGLFDKL